MHLKSIRLKEFRGFSDLTLEDIPASARLIMLIGPNGTGKSSIFDALLIWSGAHGQLGISWDTKFHIKQSATQDYNWHQSIEKIEFHEGAPTSADAWKKLCYFRSAYRNEAELTQGNLGVLPEPFERRFGRTIENDAAVSANYRRLVMQTIKDVWGSGPRQQISLPDYADAVIKKVNDSLNRVLPHLQMESLGDPNANAGNFYFTKGISKRYPFNNLSGGEKAVFDLLIDLISKMPYFEDSVICIDEPESHINPAVQGQLLRELLKLTPAKSQLLIATHAIGMLRCARDIEAQAPGTVAFINFEADFDKAAVLKPTRMDRSTWQRSLVIALDDLAALVSPKRIIVCEGGAGAKFTDDSLDAQVYSFIFAETEPDTQLFSAGSHSDTERARGILVTLAGTVLPGLEVKRLIDRDDRSNAEVKVEREKGQLVLTRRNLESYMFSDEILRLLCASEGKPETGDDIIKTRDETIAAKGAAIDDFKAAAGEVYIACKRQLGLTKSGNTTKMFMIQMLAPLVTSQTETFKQLRQDIFGASFSDLELRLPRGFILRDTCLRYRLSGLLWIRVFARSAPTRLASLATLP
jgi:predicted ATPase